MYIEGQESGKFERSINRYRKTESKSLIKGKTCQNGEKTEVER